MDPSMGGIKFLKYCQILDILGFGGDEGGGDAAVKRQAEGFANPMYQLANLMGQVRLSILMSKK